MSKYRVLSLDGGGIRGIVTVILLERLSKELAGWLDKVQLVAGTSTGGLLALGLANGVTLATMHELYVKKGIEVFQDTALDDLLDLGKLVGADYSIGGLEKNVKEILGEATTLKDLARAKVLITAFDLDNSDDPAWQPTAARTWKPKIFHSFHGENSDEHRVAWKVGLYTSAAPTYFPTVDGYVDGGVFAPNPAMCALAQTQDKRYGPPARLDDVVLLSLGTGTNLQWVAGAVKDWGYAQWAKPLVSLMLDGTAGVADYQCKQILGDRYHRLAPVFPANTKIDMDDVDQMETMIEFAAEVDLSETVQWLEANWRSEGGQSDQHE